MLDKLIIHLKNIIFFKIIIYTIFIILLCMLIPSFRDQLTRAMVRREEAKGFVSQSTIQLNSIIEFEKNIADTNIKYKALINNQGLKGCLDRTNLLKNLSLISQNYNLYEPIKAQISRLFEASSIKNKNAQIKFHDYEILLNFTIHSIEMALNLSDDIYSILPGGAFITNMTIKKNQFLIPEIIEKLSSNGSPGLIDISMKILLREIVYEK